MKARTPIRPTHPRTVKTLQQQKEKKPDDLKKVPGVSTSTTSKIIKPPAKRPEIFELQKPLPTSCETFSDLIKVFNSGTDELRHLFDFECELIYECKVCRSLFRSLSNFIQHKRAYCFERSRDFRKNLFNGEVVDKVVHLDGNNPKGQLIASRKTMRKDIYDLLKKVGNLTEDTSPEPLFTRDIKETDAALLSFFQQQGKAPSEERSATLGADGVIINSQPPQTAAQKETKPSQPPAASQPPATKSTSPATKAPSATVATDVHSVQLKLKKVDDNKVPKCLKCNETFSSLSEFNLHTSSRSCTKLKSYYVCPVCQKAIRTPYSVYRHLRKVHNKSLDQVQKLRSKVRKNVIHCDLKSWKARNRPTSPVSKAKASLPVPTSTIKRSDVSPDRTRSPSKTIVEVRSYGKSPTPSLLPAFMRKQPLVVLTKTAYPLPMTTFSVSDSSESAPSTSESHPPASQPQTDVSATQPQPSPRSNPPKKPRVEKDLSWLKRGPSVPIVGGPLTRTARALYGSPKKNKSAQDPVRGKSNGVDSRASKDEEVKVDPVGSNHQVPREASPSDNDTDEDELKGDDDAESLDDAAAMNKRLSSSEDNVRSLTSSVHSFDSSPAKMNGEKLDMNDRMSTSGVETDLSPDVDRVTPNQSDDESNDVDRLVSHFQNKSSPLPPPSGDRSSESGCSGSAEDSGVASDERSCIVLTNDVKSSKVPPPKLTVAEPSKAKKHPPSLDAFLRLGQVRPVCVDRKGDETAGRGGCVVSSPIESKKRHCEDELTDSEDCQEEQADDALCYNMNEIIFGSLPPSCFGRLIPADDDLSS